MAERFINAAKDGYVDLLRTATKRDVNTPDEDGRTCTIWAAHNGHLDALRLIVGRGGEVDKCDYMGMTALHHAASRGLMPVVTYLVNWGASIFSLDNDYHSPLDLASLHEKTEVMQYLDGVHAEQQRKNPKHVARLKEEAVKNAERNIKRYERLQEEAARRAQKEQRKLTSTISQEGGLGQTAGQGKQTFIKTLTMRIRGSSSRQKMTVPIGKTYSDMAGLSYTEGIHSGVAKRAGQHRSGDVSGVLDENIDFKISDVDESGKRTLRSLTSKGVRSMSSEVMYLAAQRGDDWSLSSEMGPSRPAVYDVFSSQMKPDIFKTKSESDLLNSGEVSNYGDLEDDENLPGIFNRPGFGKTAFLTGSNFLGTIHSFENQQDTDLIEPDFNVGTTSQESSLLSEDLNTQFHGSKEVPWDSEEVDNLDDDDEVIPSSALEMFLWSAGLEAYLHKFLKEKVDMSILVKMSDSDLKEIELPFGPRKKLLDAIKYRQDVLSQMNYIKDSFL